MLQNATRLKCANIVNDKKMKIFAQEINKSSDIVLKF